MNLNSNRKSTDESGRVRDLLGLMRTLDNKIEAWVYNLIKQLEDQNQGTMN